jgi:HAD superfamily phosphoserine phosphatase-like hydrolase
VRHFGGDGPWHDIERQLDSGEMTLRAALALEASYVRATLDDADVLLRERVRIDPSFASFVAFCETREYPLTVVSSGIQPLIERALERVGLGRLTVVANPVTPSLDGWRMDFRDDSDNGNDKAALVAAASGAGFATVFVGDGRSDYGAALAADRRFAKRGRQLEAYLRERDVPFEPFTTFADVTAAMRAAA